MRELPADARALVLTASNRAHAGVYEDRSGRALVEGLVALGFDVEGPHVRPDDVGELAAVLRARAEARSWAEIGVYLSLTGEGLRRRYADVVTERRGSTPAAKRGRRPRRTATTTP